MLLSSTLAKMEILLIIELDISMTISHLMAILLFTAPLVPAHSESLVAPDPIELTLPIPEEARKLGHHGIVVLQGIAGPDGRLRSTRVEESSNSEILDVHALNHFEGSKIPQAVLERQLDEIRLEIQFNTVSLSTIGSYSCEQAVLDSDWFLSVNPKASVLSSRFMNILTGVAILRTNKRLEFLRNHNTKLTTTIEAIKQCRINPDKSFLGTLLAAARK
jgi:Gram-negative bacterial TonB protein C-terminal